MNRVCQRETGPPQVVYAPHKGRSRGDVQMRPVRVQPRCWGPLRTLYVREIVEGEPKGWRAVGTVCLRCHAVELDEARLPRSY